MFYPEFSNGNWPAIPTRVTDEVMLITRKDSAIDRQFTHRQLEFLCQSLNLFDKPKLFTIYDSESFKRSIVLTVPKETRQNASKQLFVAVNSESSEKGDDGFELRRMTQYAYRWLVNDSRIARSKDTTATRESRGKAWTYEKEFGPFIVKEGEFVSLKHWEAHRLPAPNNTVGRLSVAWNTEIRIGKELIETVQKLTPASENENINLISEEL